MVDTKRKAMIFLSLAFVLAVVTAWLVVDQVGQAQATLSETTKVAVAKTDIQAYTEITADMIDWVDLPASSDLPSLVQDEKELEGHVAIVNLEKGEPFTVNLVRSRMDIPNDHRVVWLNPTNNVVLDQSVVEGDKVDIIVSYKSGSGIRTERILENIPVVQSQELKSGDDESNIALKVSLPVSQAEQLIHMQNTAEQVRVLRLDQLQEEEQPSEEQPSEQPPQEQVEEKPQKEASQDNANKEAESQKEQPKDNQEKQKSNDDQDDKKDD